MKTGQYYKKQLNHTQSPNRVRYNTAIPKVFKTSTAFLTKKVETPSSDSSQDHFQVSTTKETPDARSVATYSETLILTSSLYAKISLILKKPSYQQLKNYHSSKSTDGQWIP
ncbi:hypothetical protein DDB_G0284875 [Dictyostelium discoideum AX4]|uniref:Uncharacterized protein n=1 Tax=Dictyostelium discoideum TaxID=44689 RepID=Q54P20_DICDI|nr:hypothetical protein DDB_G0284875 [Dictyostelium discoideum AX4]EAL64901.1 hypothetical protein DDB_G0284875 [Dictyostelium discoideum AX4]|eukprot:XP_639897.1 hypothetical protein DDB_G0284875 [Dictyostelium discoideum AX4]